GSTSRCVKRDSAAEPAAALRAPRRICRVSVLLWADPGCSGLFWAAPRVNICSACPNLARNGHAEQIFTRGAVGGGGGGRRPDAAEAAPRAYGTTVRVDPTHPEL